MSRENFKTELKYTKHGIPYESWKEIPEEHIPNQTHLSMRVWVSGFKSSEKMFLLKCHKKGDQYFPDSDGYTVLLEDMFNDRIFHGDRVRLHPIEYRKRRGK